MRQMVCTGNPLKKMLMKRLVGVSLVTAVSALLMVSKANATGLPLINSASVSGNSLFIQGANFVVTGVLVVMLGDKP